MLLLIGLAVGQLSGCGGGPAGRLSDIAGSELASSEIPVLVIDTDAVELSKLEQPAVGKRSAAYRCSDEEGEISAPLL